MTGSERPTGGAHARVSAFTAPDGAREVHVLVEAAPDLPEEEAADVVADTYAATLARLAVPAESAVFRRLFTCDAAAHERALLAHPVLGAGEDPVAVSVVEQPPLPRRPLALWAYHVDDPAGPLRKARDGHSVALQRPGRVHVWTAGVTGCDAGPATADQTRWILAELDRELARARARLADHTVRTWFFVRDIDREYGGLVAARREVFAAHGLTAATHFIASTGIAGRTARGDAQVALDAWSIAGLDPGQIAYLAAPEHLGPTSDYGVTFERGATVTYGDRRHVLVSGTASIDRSGAVVGVGDLGRQLARMADNVDALLAAARVERTQLALLVVYLRDADDEPRARALVETRYPGIPHVIVQAPICRPTWLVELEALAVTPAGDARWPAF
ncbi:MAG: translation initiation inhibitor [Deltaproteobacteria bacterium]|nr:MAG: translation initiation inhibitor [Deltaproteobacteria bacterium]